MALGVADVQWTVSDLQRVLEVRVFAGGRESSLYHWTVQFKVLYCIVPWFLKND